MFRQRATGAQRADGQRDRWGAPRLRKHANQQSGGSLIFAHPVFSRAGSIWSVANHTQPFVRDVNKNLIWRERYVAW
jgi:hypothetical protein